MQALGPVTTLSPRSRLSRVNSSHQLRTAPQRISRVVERRGSPLDPSTSPLTEGRFNRSFSDVRIHADEIASQSAAAVDLRPSPRAVGLVQRADAGGAAGVPTGGSGGSTGRPVFLCSKPIMLSWLHGKSHAFFRVGGSGIGNDTYELEHGKPCPNLDCYQGFPRHNEPEDRDAADATCVAAPTISEASLIANAPSYPIGQYCTWGPNSNTYVRVIIDRCGAAGLRPPGDTPGFDDPPPRAGTYGPNPYLAVSGLCIDHFICSALCGAGGESSAAAGPAMGAPEGQELASAAQPDGGQG
jgi:hypothetical protein